MDLTKVQKMAEEYEREFWGAVHKRKQQQHGRSLTSVAMELIVKDFAILKSMMETYEHDRTGAAGVIEESHQA